MSVWVVGATSMLGWSLATAFERAGARVQPICNRHNRLPATQTWQRINVDVAEDWNTLAQQAPATVIYAGGICDVERCDTFPDFAHAVNVQGVAHMLAQLPASTRLVYCSSDHVFGGRAGPHHEGSPVHPISVYGENRIAAETLVLQARPDALVVRVGLPIGPSLSGRNGHLDWLRYRHRRGLPMTVIADERRSAVWASDAGDRIVALAASSLCGVRHLATTKACGRGELAPFLCKRLGIDPEYAIVQRAQLKRPHLGNTHLTSMFADALAAPLQLAYERPHAQSAASFVPGIA